MAWQFLLSGQGRQAPLQVTAPPLILIERDDRSKVSVGEPFELLAQVRLTPLQRLATGEQFLGQPAPAVGARHSHSQRLRLAQQRTEVLPDQRIKRTVGDVPRGAARGTV